MNNNYAKSIQRKRRLKYGSFAMALTVAVIALVVVINAIFTALAEKNMWYIDMTERNLYTPDPKAMTLLEEYRGSENTHIEFIFCMEESQLVSNEMCNMVYNLVKAYDEEFDFISVRCIDIINNPQILDDYLFTSTASPKTTSVIVNNGTNAIVYAIDSFFVSSDGSTSSIYALNADYKIASAVIRLAGDNPTAYFVEGHGEERSAALVELFEDAGYKVSYVDLKTVKTDPAPKVVVINNPKTDFWGKDQAISETDKLDTWLDGSAGLMVFLDENTNELPVLEDYLSHWGIKFERQSIRDYENGLAGTNGKELVAEYVTEGTGASLTSSIRELSSVPKAIVTACRPITQLYSEKYFSGNGATRSVSSVLTTSATAVASPLDDGGYGASGVFNVLTVTVQNRMKDSTQYNSFVLAGGTSAFSDDAYLTGSYANRDIIFNTMKQFSKKNVPIDIDPKIFSDESLSITAKEANQWTTICTVLLPAIVSGIGIFVYARRRYL